MQKSTNIWVTLVVVILALVIVYYFVLRPRMQKSPMMPQRVEVAIEEPMPGEAAE